MLVATEGGGRRAFQLNTMEDFGGLVLGLNSLCQIAVGRANDFTYLRDMQWSSLITFT